SPILGRSLLYVAVWCVLFLFFVLVSPLPPGSTLFPYTTLFRSARRLGGIVPGDHAGVRDHRALREARVEDRPEPERHGSARRQRDRKSTRLNSSHDQISYAVFCLKKKTTQPVLAL